MSVRPVVITGEPVLHRVAARVERFDAELATLVQDMFDTMDAAHGVGLAPASRVIPVDKPIGEPGQGWVVVIAVEVVKPHHRPAKSIS